MKVWVCEQYHDNDCGLFATEELAWRHFNSCNYCESIICYEGDGELRETFNFGECDFPGNDTKRDWINKYTGLLENPMSEKK